MNSRGRLRGGMEGGCEAVEEGELELSGTLVRVESGVGGWRWLRCEVGLVEWWDVGGLGE